MHGSGRKIQKFGSAMLQKSQTGDDAGDAKNLRRIFAQKAPFSSPPSLLLLFGKTNAGAQAKPLRFVQVLFQQRHPVRRQEQLGVITGIEYHAIAGRQAREERLSLALRFFVFWLFCAWRGAGVACGGARLSPPFSQKDGQNAAPLLLLFPFLVYVGFFFPLFLFISLGGFFLLLSPGGPLCLFFAARTPATPWRTNVPGWPGTSPANESNSRR